MLATIKAAKYATKTQCPKSCKSESYEVLTRSADIEPFTRVGLWEFGGQRVKNYRFQNGIIFKSAVRLKYASYTEYYHKERLLYDLNAIIASVGGSLGIFLGLSCYHLGKNLIERIHLKRVT